MGCARSIPVHADQQHHGKPGEMNFNLAEHFEEKQKQYDAERQHPTARPLSPQPTTLSQRSLYSYAASSVMANTTANMSHFSRQQQRFVSSRTTATAADTESVFQYSLDGFNGADDFDNNTIMTYEADLNNDAHVPGQLLGGDDSDADDVSCYHDDEEEQSCLFGPLQKTIGATPAIYVVPTNDAENREELNKAEHPNIGDRDPPPQNDGRTPLANSSTAVVNKSGVPNLRQQLQPSFSTVWRSNYKMHSYRSARPLMPQKEITREPSVSAMPMSTAHIMDSLAQRYVEREIETPPGELGIACRLKKNRQRTAGIVVDAMDESSPLRGAVLPGDVILEIDGTETQGMTTVQFARLVIESWDRPRILVIQRDTTKACAYESERSEV